MEALKEFAAWKHIFNLMAPVHSLRKASILVFALIIAKVIDILKIIVVELPETPPKLHHPTWSFQLMEQKLMLEQRDCSEVFRFRSFEVMRTLLALM